MKRYRIIRGFILLLCFCMVLSGCAIGGIRQNPTDMDLPQIDPEDGVSRDVTVTLYYRLTNENYLVGITRSISVRANERVEKAMIRALLGGVPLQALSKNVSPLFPENTSIVDVTVVGGIMYVTLSTEFLDTSVYDEKRAAADFSFSSNTIGQETHDLMVQEAYNELLLTRKLAVYSLVNTITQLSSGIRVQVQVDTTGIGSGDRIKLSDLGLSAGEDADSQLLEPMRFVEDYVVTPGIIAECVLTRLVNGEYELAYPLFSEDDGSGIQKPQYANFETDMLSLGSLESFTVHGFSLGEDEAYARIRADLKFLYANGEVVELKNSTLRLKREGDLYKLGYGTLLDVLKGQE